MKLTDWTHESQLSQCTALLTITALDRADRTVEFSAVAVDHRKEESAPIFMAIMTEKKRAAGGGGGSSSQSTPIPIPNVRLENGQVDVGDTVELAL